VAISAPAPARFGALRWLHRLEDGVLALLLSSLVVLAPLQILLRNVFDSGVGWIDPLLRVLVLWVGLLGALAACRGNRHINMDVVARLLPERLGAAVQTLTSLFAAGVSGCLAWHGARFVRSEIEFSSVAFAGIPAWALESVIPVAFGLMAVRFGLLAVAQARSALRSPP
jgi:TRAP-type C4-dicarboxylate transport system permease small subunit